MPEEFAGRGNDWVLGEDSETRSGPPAKGLGLAGKKDFLPRIEFFREAATSPKNILSAEDETACGKLESPGNPIPKPRQKQPEESLSVSLIETEGRPTCAGFPQRHQFIGFDKGFFRHDGIGIDEEKQFPTSFKSTAVSGLADPSFLLEGHASPLGSRNGGGSIGRVIVDDDYFALCVR